MHELFATLYQISTIFLRLKSEAEYSPGVYDTYRGEVPVTGKNNPILTKIGAPTIQEGGKRMEQ